MTCTEEKVKRYKNDRSIVKEKKPEFNLSEAVQLKSYNLCLSMIQTWTQRPHW